MFWTFMYWSKLISLLVIVLCSILLIYFINSKLKKKEFAIFLTAYIIATLIRGFTGLTFNIFYSKFDLILFITDIGIWTISYFISRLINLKLTKTK